MKAGSGLRSRVESPVPWFQPRRFLRVQQSFIAIAVATYAALWAVDRPASIGSTLAYTLPLSNLIVLVQSQLGFLYHRRRPLHS